MRTFKEFLSLAERYYKPSERLPSGKSPLEKALDKQNQRADKRGPDSNITRERRHNDAINTKVVHGADNPNYNDRVSDKDSSKIHVDSDGKNYMSVRHEKSGIEYHAVKGPDNVHSIEWTHGHDTNKMNRSNRVKLARKAKEVWDKHVSHRLPNQAIVHNKPSQSRDDEGNVKPVNRRASIYSRHGFGEPDKDNDQFAKTGREPSPKRKENNKTASRLTPLDAKTTKKSLNWDS
jgi:hypothetical protein